VTKTEALEMLDRAPQTNAPASISSCVTTAQFVEAVRGIVLSPGVPDPFFGLAEKFVWQAYKNQKHPSHKLLESGKKQ